MSFRLLLNEMTEASLVENCERLGHDVERVVELSHLGAGTDDSDIIEYAEKQDRLLVTYDTDFLEDSVLERIGVLFKPDDRIPPKDTAEIIDTIEDVVDQQYIIEYDGHFQITQGWI